MNNWIKKFYKFFLFALLLASPLLGEVFFGPSERLIQREGRPLIEKNLKRIRGVETFFPFFQSIAEKEAEGHIGYHGTCQEYRVYQDIIRFVVEEILDIPIRQDFHFLRIPGDSSLFLETIFEFFGYWGIEVNNKSDVRKKQLFCLNYSLYSNYEVMGSCCLSFFVDGRSITPLDFCSILEPFFEDLGISRDALKLLFKCAEKHLHKKEGVLLKVFENDGLTPYELADTQAYPSKGRGYRDGKKLISEDYATLMTEAYLEKKINVSPQICLVINNQTTLNPYSGLSIERFDSYSPEEILAYEQEMRVLIKGLSRDKRKVDGYRERLFSLW